MMVRTRPSTSKLQNAGWSCIVQRVATAVGCVTVLTATAACSHSATTYAPEPGPQVALTIAKSLKQSVTVGVVVTSTSAPGQGADFLGPAAGVRVAAERLGIASAGRVRLEIVDDHGTSSGSAAAVSTLLSKGVIGIVYASSGSHIDAGVKKAQAAKTAVLLPYATQRPRGSGVWLTGPTSSQLLTTLGGVLSKQGLNHPLVMTAGTTPNLSTLPGNPTPRKLTINSATVKQVSAQLASSPHADSIVVWAPAVAEADAAAAAAQSGRSLPVLFGPAALSPQFSDLLTTLGSRGSASTSGQYVTAGVSASDPSTGAGVVAFLAGLRFTASDTSSAALLSTETFSADGAGTADTRSQDAVLALVGAAAKAPEVSAAAVETSLASYTTPSTLGLAGPSLNFTSADALSSNSVVPLQATTAPSGQRTGIEQTLPALSWFALSDTGG